MKNNSDLDQKIIEKAVSLSVIEIFLGSFLHVLRIPFAGHFLSLNQGAFLSYHTRNASNRSQAARSSFEISIVVATMKALAPAGKKLGPMISISMQGLLYALGLLIFGKGVMGQALGMVLLSLWAFVQPFVTYFIIYGTDLIKAFNYFINKIGDITHLNGNSLYWIAILIIISKAIMAFFTPFLLHFVGEKQMKGYENFLTYFQKLKSENKHQYTPLKGALKDMMRIPVMASFILMTLFFILHGQEKALILWKILRAIAIAFLIFYFARTPLISKVLDKLANRSPYFQRILRLGRQTAIRVKANLS